LASKRIAITIAVLAIIGLGIAMFFSGMFKGSENIAKDLVNSTTTTVGQEVPPSNDNKTGSSPVAANDIAITPIGMATVIPVLANDTDPDGDTLSVTGLTSPSNGSAETNMNGSITYHPNANFLGKDVFTYTVSDGNNNTDTASVTVTITEEITRDNNKTSSDHPLVADAGSDQAVNEGNTVFLDATKSNDPDGDALQYSWTQTGGPAVTLISGDSTTPSFTAPEIPSSSPTATVALTLNLTVDDGNHETDTDTVVITVRNVVENQPPIADAGPDQTVNEGARVTLYGSNSTDPDSDSLTYSWKQIDGPLVGLDTTATNPPDSPTSPGTSSANPSFTAPSFGSSNSTTVALTFNLTVDDGNHETDTDTVVITVRNVVENQPPIADAGTSQTVREGDDVTLSGSGSSDPDGDLLTYSWNQTAGPSVELNNASSANPTFSAPQVSNEEKLTFLLKVSDGNSSSTDNVNVYTVDTATSHVLLGTPDYMNDVANRIKDAKQFVYAAMYYAEPYPTNKIINELEKAKDRGVDVRLVFSEQNVATYPTVEKEMSDRGIPYKVISNHAKVVVIDNKTAYVGSANWNYNGLENNQELSLKTSNPDTIREAFEYVDILWEKGGKKVDYADKPAERFANGLEFYNLLLDSLRNATSVKILMYEATYNFADPDAVDSKVLNEIKNAHDRGADLKLLFDDPTYYGRETGQQFLAQNGIPHRLDEKNEGPGERLHAKAVLIDDKILFVGSQNWNEDSIASPQEASIVTRDSQTISDFLAIFNEKWDAGHPPP